MLIFWVDIRYTDNMKVRIEIDTRTFVRFWLVVIGFALAILAVYRAREALLVLGISAFLALALNSPVTRLARHLPGRSRVGGTAIAYVVVVVILAAFIFLVIPPIIEQTVHFAQTVPGLVDNATTQWHSVSDFIARYHMQPQVDNLVASVKHMTDNLTANSGQIIVGGVGSLLSFITALILVLVLTFLMLVEGPEWLERLWGSYTNEEKMKAHHNLARRMYMVVNGYVTGQLTVSAIGGALAGLAVFVMSFIVPEIPADLALPAIAITFVLSLIPMFGATFAGLLIMLLLMFNNVTAGIIYIVYFFIYQQVENNLVAPSIQSRKLDLSPLAVLVAVTVGLYVFGILGGIISIPVAGCVKVLIEDYLGRAKKERDKSEKPLAKLAKKIQGEKA